MQPTQPVPHPTRVADLQAEVVLLRGHKACCEHTTLSLLQELLQVHACLQLQDSELKRLQQAAQAPEKEALQVGRVGWEAASPGVRAAVSWTLSPTQPLLLRPGPRVPLCGPPCPCWSSWEGLWPALSSPLHLAVPQPAEPEPDADPEQEVPLHPWSRLNRRERGFGEAAAAARPAWASAPGFCCLQFGILLR